MDNSSVTVMLGLEGMAVLAVSERDGEMEYAIQSTASTGWCPRKWDRLGYRGSRVGLGFGGWGLTFVAVVDAILLDDRLFAV